MHAGRGGGCPAWYRGRRVLITGGSSGIGLATARVLAEWGAHVWVAARSEAKLEEAVKELRALAMDQGQRLGSTVMDVGDNASILEGAPKVLEGLGGLDLLVNNAGVAWPGYVHELSDERCQEMLRVNCLGPMRTTRAFLPHFMEQRSGHVANVASAAGYLGIFGYSAYSASKFGLVGYSRCLRQDLLPYGVSVSILYPTDTDTPQFHAENLVKPPETKAIAGTIRPADPDHVALALLRGVKAGRLHILPGFMNKLTWTLVHLAPWLVDIIADASLRRAGSSR